VDELPAGAVARLITKVDAAAPRLRPRLQTALVRLSYWGVSVLLRNDDWAFLNYGFAPLGAAAKPLALERDDEADRVSIQLYDRVASATDLRGKDVLEVGCGRGGGASFVARYHQPRSLTGVDLSARAIRYCRRRHRSASLTFVQGDAEQLPLASASVDAVLNVESSHGYPSFARFVDEVARVLRPGGAFLLADFRPTAEVDMLREQLAARFVVREEEMITANVIRALELDGDRRTALIRKRAPRALHKGLAAFAGVPGTPMFDAFAAGKIQYVRFALVRPDAPGADAEDGSSLRARDAAHSLGSR